MTQTTMQSLRDRFLVLADGDARNDPHGNIRAYLGKVRDPSCELDKLAEYSEAYLRIVLPPGQYRALQSPETSNTERTRLVTRAVMRMPFDYLGNAQKTSVLMSQEEPIVQLGDTLGETQFHYLRTPVETLDEFLRYGTGGDCFSTSFTAQVLYSACGLPARLALASDKPLEQSGQKDMHHCAVIVSPDGRNYYVDTSLNVEVPVILPSPGEISDSEDQSSIFRLSTARYGKTYEVGYTPKPRINQPLDFLKQKAKTLCFGPQKLWNFGCEGTPLDEVVPSMLYTLHPNVPPSAGNSLNRNQQLRVNAYVEGERGTGRRERVFYHEAQGSYLSRPIENRLQLETTSLGAKHNPETGEIEGDIDRLINHINRRFGIDPIAVERSIEALNKINRKNRKC